MGLNAISFPFYIYPATNLTPIDIDCNVFVIRPPWSQQKTLQWGVGTVRKCLVSNFPGRTVVRETSAVTLGFMRNAEDPYHVFTLNLFNSFRLKKQENWQQKKYTIYIT